MKNIALEMTVYETMFKRTSGALVFKMSSLNLGLKILISPLFLDYPQKCIRKCRVPKR